MTIDEQTNESKDNEELQNLPERPLADTDKVKGGATAAPGAGPVPIPYPISKLPGSIGSMQPCI